ncbi:MAG TPA: flagellar hook capping FlgD N-terminal domain-containing protein [Terracidiphilus sp.]|jgi:flagellar basal-body rod modification protein FlgD|nr:flagellar hook capping FlgD N-terminal domain-containing protein [Terracidiphilus sp.]
MATAIAMLQDAAARSVHAMDSSSGSGSSGDTSNNAATITSNDFLTLLVAEMKNQDPTSNMDPNEYINQLVNVNSLQQLISINQTLQEALGTTTSDSGSESGSGVTGDSQAAKQAASATAKLSDHAVPQTMMTPHAIETRSAAPMAQAAGNFTIPPVNENAKAVAQAFTAHGISHK